MEFQRKFSTEKSCRQHLFRLRWQDGYRCPRCGHTKYSFHSKRNLYQCKSCKSDFKFPYSLPGKAANGL